jgi:amphi-Trp domain-containing protein
LEEKGVVNINKERKIEANYSFGRAKLANFLARVASEIANGKLIIKGEEIRIPRQLDLEYEFKVEDGQSEIEIEMKWKE